MNGAYRPKDGQKEEPPEKTSRLFPSTGGVLSFPKAPVALFWQRMNLPGHMG